MDTQNDLAYDGTILNLSLQALRHVQTHYFICEPKNPCQRLQYLRESRVPQREWVIDLIQRSFEWCFHLLELIQRSITGSIVAKLVYILSNLTSFHI